MIAEHTLPADTGIMKKRFRRAKPGLRSMAPPRDGLRLTEEVRAGWLWIAGAIGVSLVILAVLLDLHWNVDNILPSVSLELGVSTLLFAVLFLLERRVVRLTSLRSVTAWEELTAQTGEDPQEVAEHYAGPVAAVDDFITAIRLASDYRSAWALSDANWRTCRAQSWLLANASHPSVTRKARRAQDN